MGRVSVGDGGALAGWCFGKEPGRFGTCLSDTWSGRTRLEHVNFVLSELRGLLS